MWLTDEQVERFHKDGFFLLPGLFSTKEAALMRAQLPALYAERRPENWREKGSDEVRTAFALHRRNEVFARLARHPRLIEPAMQLTGSKVYLQQVKVNAKAAFTGEVWQWHQDFATHHPEDGVPEPTALNLHVFLDDVNEFNGPLMFIPGSHRHGLLGAGRDTATTSYPLWTLDTETLARLVREGGIVAAKGPAGTGLIFGDVMVHGSNGNMSPWPRTIFSAIANPVENAQVTFKRPDYIHERDFVPVECLPDDCLLDG
ncbi:MAG: phytanoyl-CoA dioxygenase family protein [Candidatus Rokubacteria bacterium]|nr:phytanoyl-CoA dioxygenase family protein [Candidatus Rokubacteria bacterium]